MKKTLLFVLFVILISPLSAQQRTTTIRGSVIDAGDNSPLIGALILVDSTKHTTADAQGNFTLSGLPWKESKIEISFLGYGVVTRTIDLNQGTINLGTIRMQEEGKKIDAVTISATATPVIQKGDTTQFNASAYKTNPDADAAGLLSKMPGMEVTESGVKAQGETVARVYVNDELFFGEDAMAALNNLPSDLVESIQMFDELPDETRFSGFNDGRTQRALNVVTKGGKIRRTITANVDAGYGMETNEDIDGNYQARYAVSGRLNYITPKTTVNFNGIVNNVNQSRAGGGGGRFARGGTGSGLRTVNQFGLLWSRKFNEENRLNLSYNFRNARNRQNTLSIQDYYQTALYEERIVQDTTSSKTSDNNHNVNLRYEYKGTKNMVLVNSNASFGNSDSWSDRFIDESRNGADWSTQDRLTTSLGDSYSVNAMANWSRRLGEKAGRTFNVMGNVSVSENNSDQDRETLLETFTEDETSSHLWVGTGNDSYSNNFTASVGYNEPLGQYARLNINYIGAYQDSKTEKTEVDKFTGIPDNTTSETYSRNTFTHTGRLGFTYAKPDKFAFSASVSGQSASHNKTYELLENTVYDRTFSSILPTVNFQYSISKTKRLTVRYNTRSNAPSLERLSNVIDNTDPARLRSGNPDLKQSYSHSFNLQYRTSNVEKLTSFYVNARAELTQNSTANKTLYYTEETLLTDYNNYLAPANSELIIPVNVNGDWSASASGEYEFPIVPQIKTGIGANYSFAHRQSYTRDLLNTADEHRIGMNLRVTSNISENVDFTLRANSSYGYADNSSKTNTESFIQTVTGDLNVIFLGGFVFNTDYSFNYNNQLDKPYHVWNAYIGRKFLKKRTAEFRIEFNDILNQSRNYAFTYGTEYDTHTWNRVMGRYIMAKFTYRFNSLNAAASQFRGEDERFRRERSRGDFPGGDNPNMRFSPGGGGGGEMRMMRPGGEL